MGDAPTFDDRDQIMETLGPPVIKLVLGLVILAAIGVILLNLPGLDTTVPDTDLTLTDVMRSVIVLVAVAVVVNFGREISPRVEGLLDGPAERRSDVADVVEYFVYLVAIVIAYNGLKETVAPIISANPGMWVYDVGFLVLALVPVGLIVHRTFRNLDDVSYAVAEQFNSSADRTVDCPRCGNAVRANAENCPNCGTAFGSTADSGADVGSGSGEHERAPGEGDDLRETEDVHEPGLSEGSSEDEAESV